MSPDALDQAPAGYADAVDELETILREIEDDDVDVDLLAERVTRAAALIEFCRDRIVAARDAVDAATDSATDDD
ncbi:MAG: exodeoxyribonuclease VII small subunit [Acidimicrobiales bacterium]|nr:exodeoxyribonuclease VII small subunit [Acidimicrobiales bacterium]